jgi:hypothetical protein
MNITKNVQFSSNIKAAGGLKEFNFRKQHGIQHLIYQIDVSDERGIRHSFSMLLHDGLWKIQETKIADWILTAEPLLNKAIEEQEMHI